jgi:hypothetical protein
MDNYENSSEYQSAVARENYSQQVAKDSARENQERRQKDFERDQDRTRGGSGRARDMGLDEPPSRLAEMIGKLGVLLIFSAGIVYFFKINAPAILGLSFSQLALQSGILFIVLGFYPYLVIVLLWIFALVIAFVELRVVSGLNTSHSTSLNWMLVIGAITLAIVLKRLLVSRDK